MKSCALIICLFFVIIGCSTISAVAQPPPENFIMKNIPPAPPIDSIITYYEKYATGVRIKLSTLALKSKVAPEVVLNPEAAPYIKDINKSLSIIDVFVASYRDNVELIFSGKQTSWNTERDLESMNKQVRNINANVEMIEKMNK